MGAYLTMAGSWCCGGLIVGVLLIAGVVVGINWLRTPSGRGG